MSLFKVAVTAIKMLRQKLRSNHIRVLDISMNACDLNTFYSSLYPAEVHVQY